jgi:hypothetical protein
VRTSYKAILLLLFAVTAWWRVSFGTPAPVGRMLSVDMVTIPPTPPGWSLVEERKLNDIPGSPGKSAIYQAPDGSRLTVQKRIAWADRRNLPVAFYPDDCSFLGTGWEFIVRGAEDVAAPGIRVHRIEVQRAKERLALLSAYSCKGHVTGSWHDFKMQLIWQRVRRERILWAKALVVSPTNGSARSEAGKMLLATVTSPIAF